MSSVIRLYLPELLSLEQTYDLSEASHHYLSNVMKLQVGDSFYGFDGQSGEYEVQIISQNKKQTQVKAIKKIKDLSLSPDVWLLFAPVKKDQTDFIIQKAVELGVRKLIPVLTRYTNTDKIRKDRFLAQSIEASEQCRRLDIPTIEEAIPLNKLLSQWDKSRRLYYMDESRQGLPVKEAFAKAPAPIAILVGPEGGFSEEELSKLRHLEFSTGVTLGPRILRAETAVAAALSCWQALSGDWVNYREQG